MNSGCDRWQITLLGIPRAHRGSETASLRSRAAWGALANLLIADTGTSLSQPDKATARSVLSERFWGTTSNPRHGLRQAISSYRSCFGVDAVIADRDFVYLNSEWFTTDIQELQQLIKLANTLPDHDLDSRIELLSRAESLVSGDLLEGVVPEDDAGFAWLSLQRSRVSVLIDSCLMLLYRAHTQAGQLESAFDTLCRLRAIRPDRADLDGELLRLGSVIKRPLVPETLASLDSFETAISKLRDRGLSAGPLPARERVVFEKALSSHIKQLPSARRAALQRLACIRAPFTANTAWHLVQLHVPVIEQLVNDNLIDRHVDGRYVLLPAISEFFRDSSSSYARTMGAVNQVRLDRCVHWLDCIVYPDLPKVAEPQICALDIEDQIHLSVDWVKDQQGSMNSVYLFAMLRAAGRLEEAARMLPWAVNVAGGFADTPDTAAFCSKCIGRYYAECNQFAEAVEWYSLSIKCAIDNSQDPFDAPNLLIVALHHSGEHESALRQSDILLEKYRASGDHMSVALTRVFQSEILIAIGDYKEASATLRAAEAYFVANSSLALNVANCRFWLAEISMKQGRVAEAEQDLRISLEIRMDATDPVGEAQCLVALAAIKQQKGDALEARALLRSALRMLEPDLDPGTVAKARAALTCLKSVNKV